MPPNLAALSDRLFDEAAAESAALIRDANPIGWHRPGLLSWWVDDAGRADLEAALGMPLDSSLLCWSRASADHEGPDAVLGTLWGEVAMRALEPGRPSVIRWRVGELVLPASGFLATRVVPWLEEHLLVVGIPLGVASVQEVDKALSPPIPALFRAGAEPTAVQAHLQVFTARLRAERRERSRRLTERMAEARARVQAIRAGREGPMR